MAEMEPMVSFVAIGGPMHDGTALAYKAKIGDKDCAVITKTEKGFFTCTWIEEFADIDMSKYYRELRWANVIEVIEKEVELYYQNKDKPKPPLNTRERRALFNELCDYTKEIRELRYKAGLLEEKSLRLISTLREKGIID